VMWGWDLNPTNQPNGGKGQPTNDGLRGQRRDGGKRRGQRRTTVNGLWTVLYLYTPDLDAIYGIGVGRKVP